MTATGPRIAHVWRRPQRGAVVLLPVLVLLALMVSILSSVFYRHQLTLTQSIRQFSVDQGLLLGLSLEQWAADMLARDALENRWDHAGEKWARPVRSLPVENALVWGCIVDLQSRLNLNALQSLDAPALEDEALTGGSSPHAAFLRLREYAGLVATPVLLANLVDWLDTDDEPVFQGSAEDLDYMRETPSRRAANTPMSQLDELELVAGYGIEDLRLMAPWVTVLPVSSSTPVNVNTASPELLAALFSPGYADLAAEVVAGRPWHSVSELMQRLEAGGGVLSPATVGVSSSFFALVAVLEVGGFRILYRSHFVRDQAGSVKTYQRSTATLPPTPPNGEDPLPLECRTEAQRGVGS